MQNRKLSKNGRGIIGILLVVAFIVSMVFLRDILVKRGVRVVMLTELDYMNAAEYYMQKKYGEKFEGEYVLEDSIYVHPKSNPQWHVVVEFYSENGWTYFGDNYVGYLKKAELEKYIYELVKPIYGECKVYIHPYGFALDDSWNEGTDMRTYESIGMYNAYIFTSKQAESIEEDFKRTCENFINKIEDLKRIIGVKETIALYGVEEKYFLDTLDEMSEQAFNDQCTAANPRYPLISEIKELYLDAYYGR